MNNVPKRKHWAGSWVAIALLFGMLIWVRLRLVTDIPRAAYAEPVGQHAHQVDAAPVAQETLENADPVATVTDEIR